jgi:large subunit ribosomal protein L23
MLLNKRKKIYQNPNNPMFCDVIKKTILTEKSTQHLDNIGAYMFEVQIWANKIIVRKAITHLFNVRVLKVNIINAPGKEKRRKNGVFKTSQKKIAIVYVHKDDVIMLERK